MFLTRVVGALDKFKVPYAIVGGFAVALHGAIRGTFDVDLIVQISKANFVATEKALTSIGLASRLPVTAEQVFEFREEYIRNRNLIAWSFANPQKPSEIVDVIITTDLGKLKTVGKKAFGTTIRILDIPGLIKMKTASGRPQDLEDIVALTQILNR